MASPQTIAFEPLVARRFIRARLIQDATFAGWMGTNVYGRLVPRDGLTRYAQAQLINAGDLVFDGGVRYWTNQLWQAECWARTADDAVVAMYAARMDMLLHGASGTVTGADYASGMVWGIERVGILELPPDVDDSGVIWMRAGGEYRVFVTGATDE